MRSLAFVPMMAAIHGAGAQSTWVVDQTPILDVPGLSASGTVTFGYAAGGIRLPDGGLLIADRGENTVRVLDASGKLVRSIGRAGNGPGEFQSILWAGRCGGDSLMIWDLRRRQASIAGAGSSALRQFAVPAGDTAQEPFQFSCSPRGGMVYLSAPRPVRGAPNAENPNIMAISAAVYRVGPDGAIRQRLGAVPAGEAVVSPPGGRGGAPRPLGRAARVAALDDAVVISSADSAFVSIIRADGRSTRHDLPIPLRAPTKAEFDEAVQALASMVAAPNRQAAIQMLSTAPMPATLPPISALFVDTEGLLWVQTTPPGGRALDFLVLGRDGSVRARAHLPRGLTVFDIGRDYVMGSYTDTADEMHVAVYRLRRN
jgi:hypothetical protein